MLLDQPAVSMDNANQMFLITPYTAKIQAMRNSQRDEKEKRSVSQRKDQESNILRISE